MASSRSRRQKRTTSVWTQFSPTVRHSFCIGVLLVVTASFFAPRLFSGRSIQGADTINWRANAQAALEYERKTGEMSLWAPNVFGGMPAYNIRYQKVIPQLDTLIKQVKSATFPAEHFFVLLVGMYLLVFYLTRNHFSGLLSAVGFGLTTYIPIILGVGHNTKFMALAYAPFVLLAFVYTLRNPSLLGGLLFSGALALDLRAKHPQITYYVLMLALVWWIVELIFAWREERITPFAKATGWLGLGTGLALLMAAQPYLPLYEYKQYSVRGAEAAAGGGGGGGGGGGMEWQKAMQWSQGPKELFTLVVADAFGGGGRMYWGPKVFTEGPHYVGGVIMALSVLAVWRVRSRVAWGIGAGVLATVLFSLGKYAAWLNWPMFAYFPFFNAFRGPEAWLSVSALGLAVLGGLGLNHVMRTGEQEAGRTQSLLYAFGGVAGLVLLLLVGRGLFFDFESAREAQITQKIEQSPRLSRSNPRVRQFYQRLDRRKEQRQEAFQADATRTLIAVGVALLLLWLYRRGTLPAWVAGSLVVLVVLVDLWGVGKRHLNEDRFSTQPTLESNIPTYGFDRFLEKKEKAAGGAGHFRVMPLQTPYSQSVSGGKVSYVSYHHQSVGGYHAAKLQRYQDYLDHILQASGQGPPNENAIDLMNARYILAQQELPGTRVVYRDDQSKTLVLENPDAVPRGFLVGQTEVIENTKSTWARLRDPSFDPRTTALLPEPLEAPVTPIDSGSTAEVTLESYKAPEIQWTVRTDAPRLFVASEVYYPAGWNAYLDGEQVPIRRVNYLLRGVHVPEGEHTLVMRFEPRLHRLSVWVAGSTTALVYGGTLLLAGLRLRRRWEQVEAADDDA